VTDPRPSYFISCRECGESATLPGVPDTASWYLAHSVRKHWDLTVKLHEASDEQLAAAIGLAAAAGWLG
jgi:hypothetical protein